MSIITLTTDFGLKDYTVGAVKGAIYSELIDAKIVDISHQVSAFNISEAAYIIKNTYKHFPKGTIHIISVDSEKSPQKKHLVIELDDHFFICADNGLISIITSEINPNQIVEITVFDKPTSFVTLDIFTKVACHISRGGSLNLLGKKTTEHKKLVEIRPTVLKNNSVIKGDIIYIDNYENVITNISKSMFDSIGKGREFKINAGRYSFNTIHFQYNGIADFEKSNSNNFEGTKLAMFNSNNSLTISVYKGSKDNGASSLLGLSIRDAVTIEFY